MELRAVPDVREFFREALQEALGHQQLQVLDHTEHYVVNLLAMFAQTDALFEPDSGRNALPPLALLLAEAASAPDERLRFRKLQRLGDLALFVAGFLAGSAAGGRIDVNYHVAMGGRAYGALAQAPCRGPHRALGDVFAELEAKFQPLVDALNEIGEGAARHSPADVLKLYELWQETGSRRAHRALTRLGIHPMPAGSSTN